MQTERDTIEEFPGIDQFEGSCASRVKRLTDARRLIALNSFAMSGPLDRETVVDAGTRSAVRQRISLATIYRTLFELTTGGIISVNHDFTGGLRGIPDESRF